ncbi:MAG: nuclear transport factor 2 family protein [Ktedonobacteraceae bacterium]|nr:nuclear transport factor 2 family protein [Ktedonobacteraceae bacterium]
MSSLRLPVSAWIESFNTRDLRRIVSLYSEDAELFDSGMRRPRRGRLEIERWFDLRFNSMPSNIYTPHLSRASMDETQANVPWTLAGRGPRLLGLPWLARPFHVEGVSHFVLRDGLIYRQRGDYDHLAVLKQILPPLALLPTPVVLRIYYLYLWRHGLY